MTTAGEGTLSRDRRGRVQVGLKESREQHRLLAGNICRTTWYRACCERVVAAMLKNFTTGNTSGHFVWSEEVPSLWCDTGEVPGHVFDFDNRYGDRISGYQRDRSGLFDGSWFRAVRRGIYVAYLRNWLVYFAAENIFIYIAEQSLFVSMPEVAWELVCVVDGGAGGRGGTHSASLCSAGGTKALGKVEQRNTESGGKEKMWNSTRKLLSEFYAPYNRELELLLGRKVNWD